MIFCNYKNGTKAKIERSFFQVGKRTGQHRALQFSAGWKKYFLQCKWQNQFYIHNEIINSKIKVDSSDLFKYLIFYLGMLEKIHLGPEVAIDPAHRNRVSQKIGGT